MSQVDTLIEHFVTEAKDPADTAAELLDNWKSLEREIVKRKTEIAKALQRAAKDQKGAERAGAGRTEAVTLLKGDPLGKLKELQSFLDRVIKQVEGL